MEWSLIGFGLLALAVIGAILWEYFDDKEM